MAAVTTFFHQGAGCSWLGEKDVTTRVHFSDRVCSTEYSQVSSKVLGSNPRRCYESTEYYLIENAFHISAQPEVKCLQRLEANLGLNMRAPLRESFNR